MLADAYTQYSCQRAKPDPRIDVGCLMLFELISDISASTFSSADSVELCVRAPRPCAVGAPRPLEPPHSVQSPEDPGDPWIRDLALAVRARRRALSEVLKKLNPEDGLEQPPRDTCRAYEIVCLDCRALAAVARRVAGAQGPHLVPLASSRCGRPCAPGRSRAARPLGGHGRAARGL